MRRARSVFCWPQLRSSGSRSSGSRSVGAGRLAAGLLAAAATQLVPVVEAHASESTKQCLGAYEAGQRLRQAGDLVTAASELRVCGGPACPVRMQSDCQRWLDDVERSLPTVVFRVRGDRGEQLPNVTVSIDGGAPRQLDGRALMMNPGEHRIVFEHPGYQPLETPVFVTEGEKLEPRAVTLEALVNVEPSEHLLPLDAADGEGARTRDEGSSVSAWPLALGAVGLIGGAGFVYFGVRAKSGETDLEQCSPDCSQSHVDGVKSDYLWSNVSLGVGLAGLVGAGVWLLLDDSPPQTSGTPRHSLRVGATPTWVVRF